MENRVTCLHAKEKEKASYFWLNFAISMQSVSFRIGFGSLTKKGHHLGKNFASKLSQIYCDMSGMFSPFYSLSNFPATHFRLNLLEKK